MYQLFLTGGLLMWPLLICSILTLAIVIERKLRLKHYQHIPQEYIDETLGWVEARGITERRLHNMAEAHPLGFIIAEGLKIFPLGVDRVEMQMQEAGLQVRHALEKYLTPLETIINITPLIGLLGTVVGMIDIFGTLSATGLSDINLLAGGIGKALLTTAFGLSIAIPAMIALKYYERKNAAILVSLETLCNRFIRELRLMTMISDKTGARINQHKNQLTDKQQKAC